LWNESFVSAPQLKRDALGGRATQESDMRRYEQVSGTLFSLVAAAQLIRSILGLTAQVGTFAIPIWVSVLAFLFTATLAIWAFRVSRSAA